jgi:hypothetical protein
MNAQARTIAEEESIPVAVNPWLWMVQAAAIAVGIPSLLLLVVIALIALG